MLTVGESLFGMVLQANFVVFWECDYLGNMVGANVLIEMVFEVVLRKTGGDLNLFGGFATGSGSVSVVEVACYVEMSTGGDGAGNSGNGVKEVLWVEKWLSFLISPMSFS